MPEDSLRSIYQQNEKLEEQLTFWHLMKNKEQDVFVEKVEALIFAIRQFEQSTKSKSIKTQLQNIVETWEKFLSYSKNTSSLELTVLSASKKTSPASGVTKAESSMTKSTSSTLINASHSIPQPLNHHKIDRNSPSSAPHDPELRAIIDKLSGIIDSQGDTE